MKKTKILVSGVGLDLLQDPGKFPCAVSSAQTWNPQNHWLVKNSSPQWCGHIQRATSWQRAWDICSTLSTKTWW